MLRCEVEMRAEVMSRRRRWFCEKARPRCVLSIKRTPMREVAGVAIEVPRPEDPGPPPGLGGPLHRALACAHRTNYPRGVARCHRQVPRCVDEIE